MNEGERGGVVVTWCFTPNQPLRLCQGEVGGGGGGGRGGEKTDNSELYYTRITILGSCLLLQSVTAIYMPIGYT